MKKYLLLLLVLVGCIADAYSQQKKEQKDKLTLQLTTYGWKIPEYGDTINCMKIGVVVTNTSTDTINYLEWVGVDEAIFTTDNKAVKLAFRQFSDCNLPGVPHHLAPKQTARYTLYAHPLSNSNTTKRFKIGMNLIRPVKNCLWDEEFLSRKPYATVWSDANLVE